MRYDADVVILGGGCAGLSLAVALAQHAPRLSVLTLEQRTSYTRDRTWCFWNTTDHPFREGITHEWAQWRVRAGSSEARQHSKRLRYQHLPADNFYDIAQRSLGRGNQHLLLGTRSGAVEWHGGACHVETSCGSLRSRWVFDARTPDPGTPRPQLLQRFLGWHVRTARPCFDPACVDLMDFQPSAEPGRTAFFYMLPFSSTEALVEITFLDTPHLAPEDGRTRLRERLNAFCPENDYEILYQEAGSLPMGTSRRPAGPVGPVVAIGTRGGRVKPSSGYAFQRIQRQSQAFARALGRGEPLPQRVEPRIYASLDDIFLGALERQPQRVPAYFLTLFRRVSPELLVPFLSETASSRAILSTMLALPKRDFLQAALVSGKGATAC